MHGSFRKLTAALAVAGASLAVCATGASAEYKNYVALGDSYTAGVGLLGPDISNGTPAGCIQSFRNYPHLLNKELKFSRFRDASCGGATSGDMTNTQGLVGNPPQFNRLTSDTDLVTVGVGGNDIGLVTTIADCVVRFGYKASWPWVGSPCKNRNSSYLGGVHGKLRDNLTNVIKGIRQRSPNARVLVVGYQKIIRRSGCPFTAFLSPGDSAWADDITREMNRGLKDAALGNSAEYVDLYTSSDGRDVCQPFWKRWLEPATPGLNFNLAFGHPNGAAHDNAYAQVLRKIRG